MVESHHFSILEERKELMLPPSGGDPTRRMAHFLGPTVASFTGNLPFPPLSSPFLAAVESHGWTTKVSFHGWRSCEEEKEWKKWVQTLHSLHHSVWRKAGVYEAIMGSTCDIRRNDDLVYGVAEKWCPETNTFVFPWGEATITLEDVMILGGFSVLGESVSVSVFLEEKELVEIEEHLIQERRLIIRNSTLQKPCQSVWMDRFMGSGDQLEHEAFLSLWLSRFVLPVRTYSTIEKHVFSVAIKLARGISVALAPAVLASIYRDLSLLREALVILSKKENFVGLSLLAPLQLVQVWAWERFPSLRGSPKQLEIGEPRLARWHKSTSCRVENLGLALDRAGASFQWRPYASPIDNRSSHGFYREREEWVSMDKSKSDPELLAFARFLRVCKLVGVDDCMEWYFPHRVAMQFGMDQDIPGSVPESCECDESPEIAWRSYSKPFNGILYIPSRLFDSEVTTRYFIWWQSSVKKEANDHAIHAPNPSGLPAVEESGNDERLIQAQNREEGQNQTAPPRRQFKLKLKRRPTGNTNALSLTRVQQGQEKRAKNKPGLMAAEGNVSGSASSSGHGNGKADSSPSPHSFPAEDLTCICRTLGCSEIDKVRAARIVSSVSPEELLSIITRLRGVAQSLSDEYQKSLVRVSELERKLGDAESSLKSANSEGERMKSQLLSEINGLRKSKLAMERELEMKLEKQIVEEERITKSLKAQLMEQTRKAYQEGFRDAMVKPFEDDEDDEEDGGDEETRRSWTARKGD